MSDDGIPKHRHSSSWMSGEALRTKYGSLENVDLLLPDIDPFDAAGWSQRLAWLEASENFANRKDCIREAREIIALQRKHGYISDTPENSLHSALDGSQDTEAHEDP